MDQNQVQGNNTNIPKKKGKKILGLVLIIAPFVGLIAVFILYAIVSFILASSGLGQAADGAISADTRQGIMSVINIILSFIGILCILGIMIGVPIGVVLISKHGTEKFSMKEAVGFGWQTVKNNIWFLIGLTVLTGIIYYLPSIFASLTEDRSDFVILNIFIILIFWILSIFVAFGWINISLKFADNKSVKITDLFPNFMLFLKYIGAVIIYTVIVIFGTLLLIVPGIIWSIKFMFYPYFILEGYGPIEAIKKSGEITKGAKASVFVFQILLGLINLLGALVLLVGLLVTVPLTSIAMAYVYRRLQQQTPDTANPV